VSELEKTVFKALVKEARAFYSLPNDVEADDLLEKYSRAAIRAVLAHFAEPQNITVAMLEECGGAYSLAAAMAAALKELEG
jgi:hypothetical protein